MDLAPIIQIALDTCLVAIAIALALTGWRLLRGPTVTDRVLAIDTLYVNVVAMVIVLGLRQGHALYFEAALIIALLGFMTTVALARFLTRGDVIE